MLERLTDNLSSFLRREPIAKCDLEIAECHVVALPVNKAQQSPCCLGDVITRLSRTQGNQLCGKDKPQPLQPISDPLTARPHSGVSMTKLECLTPSAIRRPTRLVYQPCPGLATGGKLFRNSFCWRSASFCWSASRACCSGLGPEPAQPKNVIATVESKINLVNSFFISRWGEDDNQRDRCGNLTPDMSEKSSEPASLNFTHVVFV